MAFILSWYENILCLDNYMKNKKDEKKVIIINTVRGLIIDEKTLISTLKNGDTADARLDVFEKEPLAINSELYDLDKISYTDYFMALLTPTLIAIYYRFLETLSHYQPQFQVYLN
jgi:phosphoglycerate dehydrogenase-like enzyme